MPPTKQNKRANKGGLKKGSMTEVVSIRTVGQLYSLCKSYDPNRLYKNVPIWKLLFDGRSACIHNKGVFGFRLIEVIPDGRFYDNDLKEFYFVRASDSPKYKFTLVAADDELHRIIRNLLYAHRSEIMVIAGDWNRNTKNEGFVSPLNSRKQLKLLR